MAPKTYAEVLAQIKAEYGIANDVVDAKLAKLIAATDGAPGVDQVLAVISNAIQPSNVAFRLTGLATEIVELVKSGKSVPKKNRSALA